VDRFFGEYPLWILPVAPSSATPLSLSGKQIETPSGKFDYSTYLGSYTVPTTILGTPVLAYPIGAGENKLPVAVQIHGPRYADRWVVQVAKEFVK
jgi:Asp-tRNA(Asn)/Glu-tRNA(Gln) amidotransferase A subunit family amidase